MTGTSTARGAEVAGWWPWVVLPAAASALVSAGLVFAGLDPSYGLDSEAWVNVPLSIGFSTVAAGIWSTHPEGGLRRLALLYTVVGLASALTLPCYGWGKSSLAGAELAAWLSNWIWALGAAPILGLGLLLYPDGSLPGRRWWPAGLLGILGVTALAATGAFTPGPLENHPDFDNPLGFGSADAWAVIGVVGFIVLMVAAVLGVAGLIVRFRRSRAGSDERAQVAGFAVVGALLVVVALLPLTGPSATVLALVAGAALPLTIGWAVVRHRLLDQRAEVETLTLRLDEVAASRRTLVTEREEERLRLRRELHDGLGPFLAAIGLGLRQLQQHTDGPDTDVVRGLADEVQNAVVEVRRICEGLRPDSLNQLGLAGALTAGLEPFEVLGPRVTVAVDELPPLPPAVEVAAYRIAMEAATNAVRHADATQVRVAMHYADGVRLQVDDDGDGVAADARPGVGVPGMVDRAEELGGWLTVEPGEERRGTRVAAYLPVGARV